MNEAIEVLSRAGRQSLQNASLGVLRARYFDVMQSLEQGEFSVDIGRIWLRVLFGMHPSKERRRHE